MAKNLLHFETEDNYRTAKRNHLLVPHVVSIKESGNIYISGAIVSKQEAEAGDIIAYDSNKKIYFIKPEVFNEVMLTQYTPVAVVVVPYSHTSDGKVVGMSLKMFGKNKWLLRDNFTSVFAETEDNNSFARRRYIDSIIKSTTNEGETLTTLSTGYLPSDVFYNEESVTSNTIDPYTKWRTVNMHSSSPSPYLITDEKSLVYHNSVVRNAFSDMNGRNNIPSDSDLVNVGDKSVFKTLFECEQYSIVPFVAAGQWYLPSIGELGYLMVRFAQIKYAIEKIKSAVNYYGNGIINIQVDELTTTEKDIYDEDVSIVYWSSTYGDARSAVWTLSLRNAMVTRAEVSETFNFRAFARF